MFPDPCAYGRIHVAGADRNSKTKERAHVRHGEQGLPEGAFGIETSTLESMKNLPPGLLDEMTSRLVAEFRPEKVILFGSHAWGEPAEDSDVDLLVIVAESDEKPVQRAVRAHRSLSGLNVSKDVLVKTRKEFERYQHIKASLENLIQLKGKVLYG